ncbi:MAG: hypothetical protein FJW20_07505 [Acidimicrobiia bacterium]|nr:hypothetical protein [Acidimicrobiia bacterium]
MSKVAEVAGNAQRYVYDGIGSKAKLNETDFPTAASPGVTTVGEWFAVTNDGIALSQHTGAAIFVNNNVFGGLRQDYQFGIALHEILHKKEAYGRVGHDHIESALNRSLAPRGVGGQREVLSSRIGQICF